MMYGFPQPAAKTGLDSITLARAANGWIIHTSDCDWLIVVTTHKELERVVDEILRRAAVSSADGSVAIG